MTIRRHLLTATLSLLLVTTAFAGPPSATLAPPTPGAGATLMDFILLLITIIQSVGIPALVVAIIYAGYTLVTAGGNEQQVSKAKVWILWTVVGGAIILAAKPIAGVVCGTAQIFDSSLSCV